MDFIPKQRYNIQDLLNIIRILRAPDGCPWDREQTHSSIRTNLIEETYEVADAIDQNDAALLQEELGDLLLQVVLHTEMEQEIGRFSFDDVCNGICKKLVYRHPHVFGTVQAATSDAVLENWENLKNVEKGRATAADRLDSVPQSLPALMHSAKIQKRADAFGIASPDTAAALLNLDSEVARLKEAVATGKSANEELGDVLFSVVGVARLVHADAEEELGKSSQRFATRVKQAENLANEQGKSMDALTPAESNFFWNHAENRTQ